MSDTVNLETILEKYPSKNNICFYTFKDIYVDSFNEGIIEAVSTQHEEYLDYRCSFDKDTDLTELFLSHVEKQLACVAPKDVCIIDNRLIVNFYENADSEIILGSLTKEDYEKQTIYACTYDFSVSINNEEPTEKEMKVLFPQFN